jgi:hypothetical protein
MLKCTSPDLAMASRGTLLEFLCTLIQLRTYCSIIIPQSSSWWRAKSSLENFGGALVTQTVVLKKMTSCQCNVTADLSVSHTVNRKMMMKLIEIGAI